jgi:polysaccharide deacetylase 2 family uncharacterized protein YibQ
MTIFIVPACVGRGFGEKEVLKGCMSKQPHRPGRSRGWKGYFLSFFLGVLLTFTAYTYLTREKPLSPEEFSQKVSIANQIINSQLYEIGISKKEILLHQSVLKREEGIVWEQSLLKIQVPRSLSLSRIEGNFKGNLSLLGKPFSIESSQVSESLQLEVKVMDRITHQLTFLYSKPEALKIGLRPKVAIVIDDLGGENQISQEILHWDLPLTFSVLPFTPHAKTIALEAQRKGKEVILHLPMEPHGYPKIKPGEGALLEKMDEERLLQQLSKDIETIPGIKGVSNHMGSRLMEDPEKMRIILSELKRRGLFFLDNRTTPQTIALQTANALGLKAMERSLFLDNSQNEKDVKEQLEKLIRIAISKGKAIGIGHPHPSTIKSLKEMIPKMQEKGIDIVPLSALMD